MLALNEAMHIDAGQVDAVGIKRACRYDFLDLGKFGNGVAQALPGLVVVGLVLMVFEAFGEDPDHEVEWVEEPGTAADPPFDEYEPLPRRSK